MIKPQRVQKLLAQAGVTSRRKAEELIKAGKVTVNGRVISLGATATLADEIKVEGKKIQPEKLVYIILNKPRGTTTTREDPHAWRTVLDLVKVPERVFPVGRLDKNTEGLLLLTNDGELANRLTHPRFGVEKTYFVALSRPITVADLENIRKGIIIEDKPVKAAVKLIEPDMVSISIHEGRKHVVRNIFMNLSYGILQLVRVKLGPLSLGGLGTGKWRKLTPGEVKMLKKSVKV